MPVVPTGHRNRGTLTRTWTLQTNDDRDAQMSLPLSCGPITLEEICPVEEP